VRLQAVDPQAIDGLSSLDAQQLHDHVTQVLYTLSDAAVATADAGVDAASDPQNAQSGGIFGFFATTLEACLKVIESGLAAVKTPYPYGFSIILLTCLLKLATFPLSKKQVESNLQMQSIQPRIKQLDEQYAGDQERLNMEKAKLFKEAEVNPLAGCLPALVSLPVWIGLYRGLTNAANEGLLTDGFFWIPSLAGPTSIAARQAGTGLQWLFPFENGAPPVGWHDAICYLVLPVLLVASQYASQQILSSGQQQQNQQGTAILKFLPLMIGWFSLNVPSGLTLYWFTNNILSVGQTVLLRSNFKQPDFSEASTSSNTIEVERVSAVQPKQVAAPEKAKRSGEKFWALMQQENGKEEGKGPIVAEVLSKVAPPGPGAKFRALQEQEDQQQVTTTATSTVEVASSPPVVQAAVTSVEEEEEEEQQVVETTTTAAGSAQQEPKRASTFKMKGKGKGQKYQKRRK
jgi:YidC/Oxa1 family membrane protein insertase